MRTIRSLIIYALVVIAAVALLSFLFGLIGMQALTMSGQDY